MLVVAPVSFWAIVCLRRRFAPGPLACTPDALPSGTAHSNRPRPAPTCSATQVIQCYTPYLSGIQLFGADHTRRIGRARAPCTSSGSEGGSEGPSEGPSADCSDDECCSSGGGGACSSAASVAGSCCASSAYTASTASTASDSEDGEEVCKDSPTAGAAAAARRLARAAARGSVLQQQQALGEPTEALFEYSEVERPHLRQPLHDQITELAEGFPGLLTLDTRDLHPTSWFAVTWVPIYRCVPVLG